MISKILDRNNKNRDLIAEITFLKKQQAEVSIYHEFAKHAKLQRQINKLTENLKNNVRDNAANNLKIKFICKILFYVISIVINLIFIRFNYKQAVLRELPLNLFSPLSWIVRWPLQEVGTMSFLFWFSVTNCVARVTTNSILF
ncbi:guided entry of tail-anchored proteins factor 1-like isoform X2 [Daktulosphaira vitifoliae]|nr:guided entry of tail-anchored proteins factor 1-like isoform X2 [Daktulosphaira vitifoliae]